MQRELSTQEAESLLAEGRWVHSTLSWAPDREMVEIQGIAEPYVSGRIAVGTAEVEQIRIGHHPRPGGAVLRIVVDFAGAGPRVAEVRGRGDRLRRRRKLSRQIRVSSLEKGDRCGVDLPGELVLSSRERGRVDAGQDNP